MSNSSFEQSDTVVSDVKKISGRKIGHVLCSASSLVMGDHTTSGMTVYVRENSDFIKKIKNKTPVDIQFAATQVGSVVPIVVMLKVKDKFYRGWLNYHALNGQGMNAVNAIQSNNDIIIAMVGDSGTKEQILTVSIKASLKAAFVDVKRMVSEVPSWQPFVFDSTCAGMDEKLPSDKQLWLQLKAEG